MGADGALGKVRSDIQQYGWHCLHVYPRVGEEGVGFTYTIGLSESFQLPEIAIFGLDRDKSHAILSSCVDDIRGGIRYPLDVPLTDVVAKDVPVIFRAVRPELLDKCFGTAIRYYGKEPFQAVVMFWPTKEGRFPWELSSSSQEEGARVV
jgi:hypothetical protein